MIGAVLLRLKVNGFKNLVDVEVRFGPFTCIAGPNGAGKSNLFDAITFLSALADRPLLDAALSVRSLAGPVGDVRRLFHHAGNTYVDEMSFEADMIVPRSAIDDLGQTASATITLLRYRLVLGYRPDSTRGRGALEIQREELEHINRREAPRHIAFSHSLSWRASVLSGRRTGKFISTESRDGVVYVEVHQDKGTGGRNRLLAASQLPRTVISTANAAETPTALVARREMQSWRLLQPEPTALRAPDAFSAPNRIGANGAHLPAALWRLKGRHGADRSEEPDVWARVANRLAELTEGVRRVLVDRDERRELLTVLVTDHQGTEHEARALSDGTLRFLALAVLAEDPEAQGLICLEEPENGIHPPRISAILRLLEELAVDTRQPVGPDNPLRQVIVNTHSPGVVSQVAAESLMLVTSELIPSRRNGPIWAARFTWLDRTWRDDGKSGSGVSKGELLSYLNPTGLLLNSRRPRGGPSGRVVDRPDLLQLVLPGMPRSAE